MMEKVVNGSDVLLFDCVLGDPQVIQEKKNAENESSSLCFSPSNFIFLVCHIKILNSS